MSSTYLAVPTNKTTQQETIREGGKSKAGDSAGGQKKEQPSGSDKSTTSPNSPNVEGKPAENGIAAKTTTQQAQPEQTKTAPKEESKDADTSKSKYPRAMPLVKMNLRYKPMPHITQNENFLYNIPKVYEDALNFNWRERDYLITSDDRYFLKTLNSQIKDGQIKIAGTL